MAWPGNLMLCRAEWSGVVCFDLESQSIMVLSLGAFTPKPKQWCQSINNNSVGYYFLSKFNWHSVGASCSWQVDAIGLLGLHHHKSIIMLPANVMFFQSTLHTPYCTWYPRPEQVLSPSSSLFLLAPWDYGFHLSIARRPAFFIFTIHHAREWHFSPPLQALSRNNIISKLKVKLKKGKKKFYVFFFVENPSSQFSSSFVF